MNATDCVVEFAMLIDDNATDNYISEQIIKRHHFAKRLVTFSSATDALNALIAHRDNLDEIPKVLFLDVYMSDSDAFEFISGFKKLPHAVQDKCHLVILSSANDLGELNRLLTDQSVAKVASKPMSKALLDSLLDQVSPSPLQKRELALIEG